MSDRIYSTGNVLSHNKKTGQKPNEELIDCLRATFAEPVVQQHTVTLDGKTSKEAQLINRANDDLRAKVEENERENVKIGAKLFLNRNSTTNLRWAIQNLLQVLNVQHLDNLILAYHPKKKQQPSSTENGTTNGVGGGGTSDEEVMQWAGSGNESAQSDLKGLWQVLEEYASAKKISQLGVADLDVSSLETLYGAATIKPTIVQINLLACCVVPPPLQEFCNKNDIQLLTHSDPEEIVSESILREVTDEKLDPIWTIRYQVHVKCRGVLIVKGYLVGVDNNDANNGSD